MSGRARGANLHPCRVANLTRGHRHVTAGSPPQQLTDLMTFQTRPWSPAVGGGWRGDKRDTRQLTDAPGQVCYVL
ncbi:hypothetical protein J6590_016332 [Homalodisca vitripennis]|nr:hypothetical protein J6590_016332 [Homalodisca vitripennis]